MFQTVVMNFYLQLMRIKSMADKFIRLIIRDKYHRGIQISTAVLTEDRWPLSRIFSRNCTGGIVLTWF